LFKKNKKIFSVWEISTGRCLRTVLVGGIVRSVEWNPNKALSLVAVVADRKLLIINPGVGDHLIISKTDSILSTPPVQATIGMFCFETIFLLSVE